MRIVLLFLSVFLIVSAAGRIGFAQGSDRSGRGEIQQRAADLDRLFGSLKQSKSEEEASQLASQIWAQWYKSGNDDVDLLMRQARHYFQSGRHGEAITRIDQALRLDPRYAEAWNLRATIHFYMGEDVQSVADIERTLALEPRHFGALAGMTMINMRAENWSGALKSLEAALQLHPFLKERRLLPKLKELAKGRAL